VQLADTKRQRQDANLRKIKDTTRPTLILAPPRTVRDTMLRLTSILYSIIGTTLAGIGIVIAVSMGLYDVQSIVVSAAIGAIAALPASWLVAKRLQDI
jgi:hypothetical protein